MSDDFEKQLKNALRSVDPAEGFADRVMGESSASRNGCADRYSAGCESFSLGPKA